MSFEMDATICRNTEVRLTRNELPIKTTEAEVHVGLQGRRDRLSAETAEARRNYRPARNCRDYVY